VRAERHELGGIAQEEMPPIPEIDIPADSRSRAISPTMRNAIGLIAGPQ